MKKRIAIVQLIVSLLVLIFFRFITTEINFMTNWGLYFFLVPLIFSFALIYSKKETLIKVLLGALFGGVLSIILHLGPWSEGYVLLKLLALASGAIFSLVEYRLIKE